MEVFPLVPIALVLPWLLGIPSLVFPQTSPIAKFRTAQHGIIVIHPKS